MWGFRRGERGSATNNDSVFFDFRVYRAFVNTEIKEHGNDLKNRSVCQEFSLSNGSAIHRDADFRKHGSFCRRYHNPRCRKSASLRLNGYKRSFLSQFVVVPEGVCA